MSLLNPWASCLSEDQGLFIHENRNLNQNKEMNKDINKNINKDIDININIDINITIELFLKLFFSFVSFYFIPSTSPFIGY